MASNYILEILIVLFINGVEKTYQKANSMEEYCIDETFQAACDANEVIVIKSAQFGRMNYGKCMSKSGDDCITRDVLSILDSRCSGRRLCDVDVIDAELMKTNPCGIPDYSPYLKAEYYCQKVHIKTDLDCASHNQPSITLQPESGYLASLYSTFSCHYIINVQKGQQVVITLMDFVSHKNVSQREGATSICQQIVIIREPEKGTSNTVCRSNQRERVEYTSKSDRVELRLKNINTPYLIGYKITGCAMFKVPSVVEIVKQEKNLVVLKCKNMAQKKHHRCVNGQWEGEKLNCTAVKAANHEKHEDTIGLPPLGVSMFIIFGVALVIVIYVAGMIVCVMYIKRKKRHGKDRPSKIIQEPHNEDLFQYDKIFTNPHDEHLPMLLKTGSLRRHQQQLQCCDCSDNFICQIHGPFHQPCSESPYIVAGPKICQCEVGVNQNMATNQNSATTTLAQDHHTAGGVLQPNAGNAFPNCCISATSMPSNIDRDDTGTYQSSRSLKSVRFANNALNNVTSIGKPFYLELNSRGLSNNNVGVNSNKGPDILPSDGLEKVEETQLTTFR